MMCCVISVLQGIHIYFLIMAMLAPDVQRGIGCQERVNSYTATHLTHPPPSTAAAINKIRLRR